MHFYAKEQIWVIKHVSGSTAGHALFLIYESIFFRFLPNRPIGCLSKKIKIEEKRERKRIPGT